MNNTIIKSGEDMKNIKLISIILVILSSLFLGCVQAPPGTPAPAPTATPTVTAAIEPTAVPTTPAPAPTPVRVPAVYKSEIDDVYGFYKLIPINSTKPAPYKNNTLTIYAGDKVIWVSDSDYTLTIVSEQGLWDNTSAKLRWRYKELNYTFVKPGTYGVYIKEYPRKVQKIIVNP